jgi:DNA primase
MDNVTEEIKSRLDIVDVISEYIQLKPAGANFKALCPFHQEKLPSFMVSPEKQIWHCFGCGKGSDIFGFIMEIEGVEFPEALRILAKKANVELKRGDSQLVSRKSKLLDILSLAALFYHQVLLKHPKAKVVRDYLKKRRVSEASIKEFQLGYAPDTWDGLLKFLKQKKFKEGDIEAAGLILIRQKHPFITKVGFFMVWIKPNWRLKNGTMLLLLRVIWMLLHLIKPVLKMLLPLPARLLP